MRICYNASKTSYFPNNTPNTIYKFAYQSRNSLAVCTWHAFKALTAWKLNFRHGSSRKSIYFLPLKNNLTRRVSYFKLSTKCKNCWCFDHYTLNHTNKLYESPTSNHPIFSYSLPHVPCDARYYLEERDPHLRRWLVTQPSLDCLLVQVFLSRKIMPGDMCTAPGFVHLGFLMFQEPF